jgi:hypothetical protein
MVRVLFRISILTYKENGRFYRQDGINSAFAEHGEGKVMMTYLDSSDAGIVKYERLNNLDDIDTSAFSGKVWVPRNLSHMIFTQNVPDRDNSGNTGIYIH